jgi:hypothetical protein
VLSLLREATKSRDRLFRRALGVYHPHRVVLEFGISRPRQIKRL